jgi:peptidoglycan hydrolase-like protein with peptidoglycan-binding domain
MPANVMEEHMTRLVTTLLAMAALPAVLAAQTDSSRMRGADSTRGRNHRQTSSGAIGRSSRLSHDQVTQLQTALQQANCNPGSIDGVMGPRTRSAMNCYRRNNNISGNNPSDVYRSLNLNFASSDSLSGGNNNRSRLTQGSNPSPNMQRTRSTHRGAADSSSRRRSRPDSTRRPSTRRDTTRP